MPKWAQIVGSIIVVLVVVASFAATVESVATAAAQREELADGKRERAQLAARLDALRRDYGTLAGKNADLVELLNERGTPVPAALVAGPRVVERETIRDNDGDSDDDDDETTIVVPPPDNSEREDDPEPSPTPTQRDMVAELSDTVNDAISQLPTIPPLGLLP